MAVTVAESSLQQSGLRRFAEWLWKHKWASGVLLVVLGAAFVAYKTYSVPNNAVDHLPPPPWVELTARREELPDAFNTLNQRARTINKRIEAGEQIEIRYDLKVEAITVKAHGFKMYQP